METLTVGLVQPSETQIWQRLNMYLKDDKMYYKKCLKGGKKTNAFTEMALQFVLHL